MKVWTREELSKERVSLKGVVGYTSGVFDILHQGHVDYLEKAKSECDVLLVGVNSDRSVSANKGPSRPYVSAAHRAALVSALRVVDYAFIFDELNNNENIRVLKPDKYIKASDYNLAKLTSKSLVEEYGGQVVLIPMTPGFSSSNIIQTIQDTAKIALPHRIAYEPRPAVFVDRDGTINKEVEYLHDPGKLEILPNAFEGLRKFQDAGYRIIVVTNQPGIGLGYFTEEEFFILTRAFLALAHHAGLRIDKVYFCPHSQSDGCNCRKPNKELLERAVKDLNIVIEESVMIGDMTADVKLGRDFGCGAILVATGKGGSDKRYEAAPDYKAADLLDAAEWWLQRQK